MKSFTNLMFVLSVFTGLVLVADIALASDAAPAEQSSSEKAGAAEAAKPHDTHAKHDDTDLAHANAGPKLADPTEFRFETAIASAIIFLLILTVLIKFAWGPISHGLEAREHDIEQKIEQARLGAEKATQQLKEYEAKLAAAAEEARGIVAQSRLDAETARDKIIAEGKAVAQQERDKAIADISLAKNLALSEIAQKSVDTAIGLATSIVRREVKPADHEVLIQDALQQFPKSSLN